MMPDPILLVDDEDDLRGNLKEALTLDGYRVEDAAGRRRRRSRSWPSGTTRWCSPT